jgi:hypothetical protein
LILFILGGCGFIKSIDKRPYCIVGYLILAWNSIDKRRDLEGMRDKEMFWEKDILYVQRIRNLDVCY